MREPEVALAFTPDPWVEDLHRHLSDHGGARVRALVVEPSVALDESYDVLVAGHRWPPLTRAFIEDVHARGRAVLGVHDREEPASRAHLAELGVDAILESDAGADGFVRAIAAAAGPRPNGARVAAPQPAPPRAGRLLVVGGPPGVGRTEVAVHLAAARRGAVLLDADDVAPAIAARLALAIEPNVCTAVDAVEHGRGTIDACVQQTRDVAVVAGMPHARAWSQLRAGEVMRVADALAASYPLVVADGAGALDSLTVNNRARFALARALVAGADLVVGVCDASPHGVARFLAWVAELRELASEVPLVVVVNRAPAERFRRAELYDEIASCAGVQEIVFAPSDRNVGEAAWAGTFATRGGFVRAIARTAVVVPT